LYTFIGEITYKDIKNYEEFMKNETFHKVEIMSWQIALFTRYGNSSGCLHVLYKSYTPALFYCEVFDTNIKTEEVKNIQRSFTPFTTLFNIEEHNYLPFDYAIVFS